MKNTYLILLFVGQRNLEKKKGKYKQINTYLILLFVEQRNLKKNKGKYNEKYLPILHCIG